MRLLSSLIPLITMLTSMTTSPTNWSHVTRNYFIVYNIITIVTQCHVHNTYDQQQLYSNILDDPCT